VRFLEDGMNRAIEDYKGIPKQSRSNSFVASQGSRNKNRYLDILAYDQTRVHLGDTTVTGGDDYINANFVTYPSEPNPFYFVVSQGPKPNTVNEHWQMIWEQKVRVVVMLAQVVENARPKCAQYWPPTEGQTLETPTLEVTNISTVSDDAYDPEIVTIKLRVRHLMTRQTVEVTHIQYRGWPDHGVPESPDKFLEVVERVEALRHQLPKETPYIQVHCSAGIGRSGVFIVVLIMLDKLRKKKLPKVREIVHALREQRMGLVQVAAQFRFCYAACLAKLRSVDWMYEQSTR